MILQDLKMDNFRCIEGEWAYDCTTLISIIQITDLFFSFLLFFLPFQHFPISLESGIYLVEEKE